MTRRRTIAILNPNATVSMTDDMVELAGGDAADDVCILGLTNLGGPLSIQGRADAEACLPGLFSLFDTVMRRGVDAVIIGCFDDTGLDQLRLRTDAPVVGLGEAACVLAAGCAPHFHVVTTMSVSVPVIEENIRAMGLAPRCASIRPSEVPVLDLQSRVDDVQSAIDGILADDPDATIVLGCAGMGTIAPGLRVPGKARLIDPVRAAFAEALKRTETIGAADHT